MQQREVQAQTLNTEMTMYLSLFQIGVSVQAAVNCQRENWQERPSEPAEQQRLLTPISSLAGGKARLQDLQRTSKYHIESVKRSWWSQYAINQKEAASKHVLKKRRECFVVY
jgi:hypothetical protein